MQRIRQVEKEMIYEEFKDRAGEIVSGTVRRFERSDVIRRSREIRGDHAANGNASSTEDYNIGDRLRAYVVAVENGDPRPGDHSLAQPSEFCPASFRTGSQRRSTTAP